MITVRRVHWDDVRDRLQETFEGDEQDIKADVLAGIAECWEVGSAALIARMDGQELVLMCLAGSDLKEIAPAIMQAARKAGATTMRFHTKRQALGRLLRVFGFEQSEVIFRADLYGFEK